MVPGGIFEHSNDKTLLQRTWGDRLDIDPIPASEPQEVTADQTRDPNRLNVPSQEHPAEDVGINETVHQDQAEARIATRGISRYFRWQFRRISPGYLQDKRWDEIQVQSADEAGSGLGEPKLPAALADAIPFGRIRPPIERKPKRKRNWKQQFTDPA